MDLDVPPEPILHVLVRVQRDHWLFLLELDSHLAGVIPLANFRSAAIESFGPERKQTIVFTADIIAALARLHPVQEHLVF